MILVGGSSSKRNRQFQNGGGQEWTVVRFGDDDNIPHPPN